MKLVRLMMIFFWGILYFGEVRSLCHMMCTPRDNIRARLLDIIKHEKLSIDCAMYMFTDKSIAQALIDAYVRGVRVRVILDHISMGDRYGKGSLLQENGIDVFVHRANNGNPFTMPIMHHKFFIFGANDYYSRGAVWTGSFNCTQSASKYNDENVIISDERDVIQQYRQCFFDLLHRLGYKSIDLEELVDL